MTQQEIKQTCDIAYQMIKDAEKALKETRALCKHPNTYNGNYSNRAGCIDPAILCSDCGEVLAIDYGFATGVRKENPKEPQ
jgi:hypothetical protein